MSDVNENVVKKTVEHVSENKELYNILADDASYHPTKSDE